ncbi:inositol-pentakisphosphate 2-kinase [Diprion similis]|uniref:inositol-pentakisphosphate 2-kinase n=1 Tax=Diprion similis TaxID=362088 RepID=UPI001EF8B76A|nr:inositol-pentakisphosphate 2-kinase [Diprion similis]XP_046746098.1 inositol-pentakisphosphate 2-kinase [Diprion similis]XP_046746099.1 inositol-pentakisphosphate 2-kinase [Diprion similis]XP_046746100.1 inositol-pentakisphosphate 2-kinase [Diprion similis]
MILNEGSSCDETSLRSELDAAEKAKQENDHAWKFALDQFFVTDERRSVKESVYRGEGNANVVLALPCERKVVRFRKSLPDESDPDGGEARTCQENQFLRHVIPGFLGEYVQPPEIIHGRPEDMVMLSEAIRPLRPESRRKKDIVEEYATKYVDYAFLPAKLTDSLQQHHCSRPTFCVEIKPKQGFRHESDEQFQRCTYCLTQYSKMNSGVIKSRSTYCPFDLFSGDAERMKKSIRGLLKSPQNNLKIFKDGNIVYDCNSNPDDLEYILAEWFITSRYRSMEQYLRIFIRLVSTALLREFHHTQMNESAYCPLARISSQDFDNETRIDQELVEKAKKLLYLSDYECNFVGGNLLRDSVLGRIRRMQELPYYSTDIVYKIYSKHIRLLNDNSIYSGMIRMHTSKKNALPIRIGELYERCESARKKDASSAAYSSVNQSQSTYTLKPQNLGKNGNNSTASSDFRSSKLYRNLDETEGEINSAITNDELRALQNYLLATTAKDCSILMAFQEIDSVCIPNVAEPNVVETDQLSFLVNVGILDLDPKSVHCIKKHRKRDINVLVSVSKVLEKEVQSVDKSLFDTV